MNLQDLASHLRDGAFPPAAVPALLTLRKDHAGAAWKAAGLLKTLAQECHPGVMMQLAALASHRTGRTAETELAELEALLGALIDGARALPTASAAAERDDGVTRHRLIGAADQRRLYAATAAASCVRQLKSVVDEISALDRKLRDAGLADAERLDVMSARGMTDGGAAILADIKARRSAWDREISALAAFSLDPLCRADRLPDELLELLEAISAGQHGAITSDPTGYAAAEAQELAAA